MSQSEFNRLGLAQSARAIAAGEITSEALVRACLDRVAQRESVVKAWVDIDFDRAIAGARQRDRTPSCGPLHGVPIGVKDIFNTYDFPTQMGSRVYEGHQAHGDAACVALLREAGAIILGKTVTCEFAGVAPSITRNPLNPAHTPGGSSSGSAAAVADFMVPAALGTQTSGSVLRPASFCGVIGFKPTFNTINREGTKLASENLDTIGVITRHVEDAALLLQVMTRSAPHPLQGASFAPRLGLCRTVLCDEKVEPATRTILENAAAKARAAGATVIDFELPADFVRIGEARVILDCVERSRGLASEWTHHRMSLSPQLVAAIERGLATSQSDYQDALRFLESTRQCFDMLIECFDGLITPTVNGEAPYGMGSTGDAALQGFWTALYAPTISIPAGVGPASMPIGLQLVARRYADEKLLEVALWMQQKAGIVATAL